MPRALADSVEAAMAPVASTLPPLADLAAQNVLGSPTLRALPAVSLARLLAVPPPEALSGIAAVVDLARRRGAPPLQRAPDLESAIGPFMSTDTALARFGAHMGPIEANANPREGGPPMTTAGTIGGYVHRFGWDDFAPEHQMGIDNDAGGFPEEYYGDRFGGNEAGLGEAPPVVVNDQPSPSPAPSPAPAPYVAPASPSTLFGVPIVAVAAAGLGAYLLLRKKGRGRRR